MVSPMVVTPIPCHASEPNALRSTENTGKVRLGALQLSDTASLVADTTCKLEGDWAPAMAAKAPQTMRYRETIDI